MIFSVWNQGAWKYDLYESKAVQDTANAPAPKHVMGAAAPLGLAPEQLCWPLPPDAVKVGVSEQARGRIARRGGPIRGNGSGRFGPHVSAKNPAGTAPDGIGGIPVLEDVPFLGVLALAFGVGWLVLRK